MNIADLGELDGPVLLFGGPYSNLQATEALRAGAERLGIAPGNCICTGDIVAYCADAAATVAEIREWGCAVVAGNCERQLAENAQDCGCGFEEGTTCDLLSAGWFAHASAQIPAEARAWMAGLPDAISFNHRGKRALVIHGGVNDISRFLWSTTPSAVMEDELLQLAQKPDYLIAGHSGIPFQRQIGATQWINAGVIGMPPHDGHPETRYALPERGSVDIRRLSYDHETARAAMIAAGLTQGYHNSLTSGIWPSEDILPQELRRSSSVARG